MIKAYPRVWVDLTSAEIVYSLKQLLRPSVAAGDQIVPDFEKAFARFVGKKHAVSFANCRSALFFSLKAFAFEPGDEIILPAFTFWVDPAVVLLAGLKPVFVDVDFKTMNLDVSQVEAAITPRTRAILPAHLNGLPVDMVPLMTLAAKHGLRVLEDCARACGASVGGQRVGSFDVGAFSFGYGKSFYGFGGGMVVSDDDQFIERLRTEKRVFHRIGVRDLVRATFKGSLLKFLNTPELHRFTLFPCVRRYEIMNDERFSSWFRIKKPELTEVPEIYRQKMYDLQARLGFRQLTTIDASNRRRSNNLKLLNNLLSDIPNVSLPMVPENREHVAVHYALWTERKRELQMYLWANGIDAQDESAEDVTQMDRFQKYMTGSYPNARKLHQRICYIPAHPCLGQRDLSYIAGKIKEFFTR